VNAYTCTCVYVHVYEYVNAYAYAYTYVYIIYACARAFGCVVFVCVYMFAHMGGRVCVGVLMGACAWLYRWYATQEAKRRKAQVLFICVLYLCVCVCPCLCLRCT